MSSTWEAIKMVLVSGTTRVDERNITAKPEDITATVGGMSILFLLEVPEIDVLTLQMEHEVNMKERSW
jgi:hypothetical protein